MPELPEVETVRSGLEELIVGARIERVELKRRQLRTPIPVQLPKRLAGGVIQAIRRRAKYLIIETSHGAIINHLGMTGSWRVALPGEERLHDHCYVWLEDGRRLAFHDPRRFGILELMAKGEDKDSRWLRHLGPEPLDAEAFHTDYLWQKSRGRKIAIKTFIMDQKVVVGVGNIYASEALFMAGVRPGRGVHRVSRAEMERLVQAIREVLGKAILAGGTTFRDFRQAGGYEGLFQQQLAVYDRHEAPCVRCQSPVQMKWLGGRSSFWCARCQK